MEFHLQRTKDEIHWDDEAPPLLINWILWSRSQLIASQSAAKSSPWRTIDNATQNSCQIDQSQSSQQKLPKDTEDNAVRISSRIENFEGRNEELDQSSGAITNISEQSMRQTGQEYRDTPESRKTLKVKSLNAVLIRPRPNKIAHPSPISGQPTDLIPLRQYRMDEKRRLFSNFPSHNVMI